MASSLSLAFSRFAIESRIERQDFSMFAIFSAKARFSGFQRPCLPCSGCPTQATIAFGSTVGRKSGPARYVFALPRGLPRVYPLETFLIFESDAGRASGNDIRKPLLYPLSYGTARAPLA